MNLYGINGIGTIVHVNGATGGYLSNSSLNIASGRPIAVTLQYAAGSLMETLTGPTTSTTYTHTYAVDIPGTVGSSTAYVGFTGGTGGATATQTISNYSFTPVLTSTPEPGSLALLAGFGVSGSFFALRRRFRK